MDGLDLHNELLLLQPYEEQWQAIWGAHFANKGVGIAHLGEYLCKQIETNDVTVKVYLKKGDDALRTVDVMVNGHASTVTVSRVALEKWLKDMRDVAEMTKLDKATDIVDEIHSNRLARQVFMDLFRHSDQLCEQLSVDDRREVFLSVLLGADDLSRELFVELCHEYGTSLEEVLGIEL